MKIINVKLTFTEPLLGTASSDPNLHGRFVASKAPDALTMEEEVAAVGVDAVEERGITVFPKTEDGTPFIWDYQVKGFFKDACGMLWRVPGTESKKLKAYKKVIDGLIFPEPRKIPLVLPEGEYIGELQRPLRAATAQGEKVALAHSEMLPIGTTLTFSVRLLDGSHEKLLREWFEYGALRGLGQWRNASMGRFEVEYL